MVQEEFTVLDDPDDIEFVGDAVIVPVLVDMFEEEYKGSSRGEEYYERVDYGDDVVEVSCPLKYIYKESDPSVDYEGEAAVEFIQDTSWDSEMIADAETMEFRKDGELWIASFDPSPLDEYQL